VNIKTTLVAAGIAIAVGGLAAPTIAQTSTSRSSVLPTNEDRMDTMMRRIDHFQWRLKVRDPAYASRLLRGPEQHAKKSDDLTRYAGR
jgi:hypothetical protein